VWQVDPEKIVVLPNGVDIDLFQPRVVDKRLFAEYGLSDGPVITFVGGFQPWHGLDILVESFANLLNEIPNANLLLVGDGRARPLVEENIHKFGLEKKVRITGLVPQTKIPAILDMTDIAVMPYPQLPKELWFSPLKMYEYMASGCAIVASRDGQIADVIQDGQTGFLVEPGSVSDLTRAMVRLINDPAERKRLGSNARRQAVERHSWEKYIERLESVYLGAVRLS
jgi:glycosyltransferase involved in cell wall biosynthesis